MKSARDMEELTELAALVHEHKAEFGWGLWLVVGTFATIFIPAFGFAVFTDHNVADHFGSFIGGFGGTVFLIVSVMLLLGTYRNQRATNRRSHVEARVFELLKYHRENVADLGIDDGKLGQRVFVSMIREFRDVWKIVDNIDPAYPAPRKLDLAYMAFYYGAGPNSTRILEAAVDKKHPANLVEKVAKRLTDVQRQYRVLEEALRSAGGSEESIEFRIRHEWSKAKLTSITYRPFDGHQSRLGHYYRHLYQTAKYINQHGGENSSDYAGVLRAQLSNHEQALLALNALSEIGKKWRTEKLLTDFALIKNIPEAFFPQEIVYLKKEFPGIIFEYEAGESSAETSNRTVTDSITII